MRSAPLRGEGASKTVAIGLWASESQVLGQRGGEEGASWHPQLNTVAVVFVVTGIAGDALLLVQARLGPLEVAGADAGGVAAGWQEFGVIEVQPLGVSLMLPVNAILSPEMSSITPSLA